MLHKLCNNLKVGRVAMWNDFASRRLMMKCDNTKKSLFTVKLIITSMSATDSEG